MVPLSRRWASVAYTSPRVRRLALENFELTRLEPAVALREARGLADDQQRGRRDLERGLCATEASEHRADHALSVRRAVFDDGDRRALVVAACDQRRRNLRVLRDAHVERERLAGDELGRRDGGVGILILRVARHE